MFWALFRIAATQTSELIVSNFCQLPTYVHLQQVKSPNNKPSRRPLCWLLPMSSDHRKEQQTQAADNANAVYVTTIIY